jgi:hypothetical protein
MINPIYDKISQELISIENITSGQMFGKPCLKIGNKAFAAWFKSCMVFKLGQDEIKLIKHQYPGSENWDPSGKNRAMKDWLQMPEEYSNQWLTMAKKAIEFVR